MSKATQAEVEAYLATEFRSVSARDRRFLARQVLAMTPEQVGALWGLVAETTEAPFYDPDDIAPPPPEAVVELRNRVMLSLVPLLSGKASKLVFRAMLDALCNVTLNCVHGDAQAAAGLIDEASTILAVHARRVMGTGPMQ